MKSKTRPRRRFFISISVKMLFTFFITFSIIAVLQSAWYFITTIGFAIDRIQANQIDLTAATVYGLDINEIVSLAQDGNPNEQGFSDDWRYKNIMDWLDTIHQVSLTTWPYVFVPGENANEIIYLADLAARYRPESAKNFLEPAVMDTSDDQEISSNIFLHINLEEVSNEARVAFPIIDEIMSNSSPVEKMINQVVSGGWFTTYSYIRDDEGRVVAGVGIVNESSIVNDFGRQLNNQLGLSFIVSLFVMLLVGLRLGTVFSKPIVRLTQAAEIINAGDHQAGLKKLEKAGNPGMVIDEIDRLVETIRKLVHFQNALYTISATANKTNDLNVLFNLTYREVREFINPDIFTIGLFNPETKTISLHQMTGLDEPDCKVFRKEYPLGSPPDLIGYVIESGKPLMLSQKEAKILFSTQNINQTADFTAWLGVPLQGDDQKTIGVLAAQSHFKGASFSENDKALFTFIANHLGMIIHRQDSENELRQSYQLLEQRVQDRTSDLQNANVQLVTEIKERERVELEILKAKEAAETANIAKSAFLANMSHELRTPLNAILGFSHLMAHDPNLPTHHKEDLDIILQSGEHLLSLINDVLEMSKIEAGRNSINLSSFDLHQLLLEVEEVFQSRAGEKGLSLVYEPDANLPQYIVADQKKLRQVFLNLFSNAIKFTETGGVTLRSRLSEQLSPTEFRLSFELEDTGPGIEEDQLESLFDYFVQTDAGKKSQEGTGLGLAISKNFVRMLGGDISVASKIGRGSIFSFDICVTLANPEDLLETPRERRAIGLVPGQSTWRILIVEDRDANRKLLIRLLQPFNSQNDGPGFKILDAVDGRQALTIWEEWSPHLIFMDMRMPEMDGHEATQRIRATIKGQAVVIIALTASAFEEDRKLILSEGINDFIRKPFKEHEIFDVLSKYLGVHFTYADEETAKPAVSEAVDLNIALLTVELQSQSSDWVTQLRKAATAADSEVIFELLNQATPQNPKLVSILERFVVQYRFDLILNALPVMGEK